MTLFSPRQCLLAQFLLAECLLAAGLSLCSSAAMASSYTSTPFTVQGATYVYPQAINDAGTAVGYYGTPSGAAGGFTYAKGTVTLLNYPNALQTFAQGINSAGTIVGTYTDASGSYHGFTYTAGTFTSVDYAGAVITNLEKINDQGVAVGTTTNRGGVTSMFTYAKGVFTPLKTDSAYIPIPVAINDAGEIAGWYTNSSAHGELGFIYANGTATTLQPPGKIFYTQPYGINKSGTVVGQAATTAGKEPAFVYRNGHYRLASCSATYACIFYGINDSGLITGANAASPSASVAFVERDKGSYQVIPAPGGDTNYAGTAINNEGVVVGETSTGAFIATPTK